MTRMTCSHFSLRRKRWHRRGQKLLQRRNLVRLRKRGVGGGAVRSVVVLCSRRSWSWSRCPLAPIRVVRVVVAARSVACGGGAAVRRLRCRQSLRWRPPLRSNDLGLKKNILAKLRPNVALLCVTVTAHLAVGRLGDINVPCLELLAARIVLVQLYQGEVDRAEEEAHLQPSPI